MRIVSWNIELGQKVEQAASELTSITALAGADVVLLQEMDPDGVDHIADALGCDRRYFAPADHCETGRPFGNAVLSAWPMGEVAAAELPHIAPVQGQPRAATSATVTVDGTMVVAYSVHLETVLLDLRRRAGQVNALASHVVRRSDPHPVVIGGDFNSASRRSISRFDVAMRRAELQRVTSEQAATFHRFGRSFALDHLYVKGLRPLRSGVVAEAGASDHQPVWVDLEIV